MGIFDNLKEAKVYDQGVKLPDGQHVVRIEKCLTRRSSQLGCDLYIVEYTAIQSQTATVNGKYSWVQNDKDHNVASGNIKAFVMAVMKANKEVNPDHYAQVEAQCEALAVASVDKGMFNGQLVKVDVSTIKTKGTGRDFKRHTFQAHV